MLVNYRKILVIHSLLTNTHLYWQRHTNKKSLIVLLIIKKTHTIIDRLKFMWDSLNLYTTKKIANCVIHYKNTLNFIIHRLKFMWYPRDSVGSN